jgi:hypothetical protein
MLILGRLSQLLWSGLSHHNLEFSRPIATVVAPRGTVVEG